MNTGSIPPRPHPPQPPPMPRPSLDVPPPHHSPPESRRALPVSTIVALLSLGFTVLGAIVTVAQTWTMFDARITHLERADEQAREVAAELKRTREELSAIRGALNAIDRKQR